MKKSTVKVLGVTIVHFPSFKSPSITLMHNCLTVDGFYLFPVPDLKEVDVIDVEKQDTFKMSVVEYFKYIMSPDKTRILNLISMEVSKTR